MTIYYDIFKGGLAGSSAIASSEQGVLADTALQPDSNETVTGAYTFTGPLILPNNSRVNGIEHFYQTTKPTVRGDSSALVAGDRWWKTDDGTEWFWNGTYWLSPIVFATGLQYEAADLIANPSGRTTAFIVPPEPNSFLLREISFEISTNGYWTKVTAEQHHIFQLNRANNWANFVALTGATYNTFTGVGDKNSTNYVGVTAAGFAPVTIVVNEVINNNPAINGSFLTNNFRGIIITATAVGSPMTGSPLNLRSQNVSISYNTIHP